MNTSRSRVEARDGWKELPGYCANHVIANPTPGNLWVRAASRTANALSDYTAPVLLVVK